MALAIWFDEMIRTGEVESYVEIARIGGVSRPRVTQIMDLLNLSPTIQQKLLADQLAAGMPTERSLRDSSTVLLWAEQVLPPNGIGDRAGIDSADRTRARQYSPSPRNGAVTTVRSVPARYHQSASRREQVHHPDQSRR